MQTVKHIVMWKLRGANELERHANAQKVKSEFESIRDEIPGLTALEIGVDISKIDYACDVVLYTEFESIEALHAYATHPAHTRVRQALGDIREHRYQVDYLNQ